MAEKIRLEISCESSASIYMIIFSKKIKIKMSSAAVVISVLRVKQFLMMFLLQFIDHLWSYGPKSFLFYCFTNCQ